MSSTPVSKKVKMKFKKLHLPAIFSPTLRPSSPNPLALPGISTAPKPNDTPGQENDQRSHENPLSTQPTLSVPKSAVINTRPTPSDVSDSSPHLSSDPEPKTSDKVKRGLSVAWNGLETALRLLERSADAFPPLKSAVGGLVALLDLREAVMGNDEEYKRLATEFTSMAEILTLHGPSLAAEDVSGSVARIVKSINEESTHIKQQQGRFKMARITTAIQDQGDIIQRCRTIESLFRQLQNEITLRNWDDIRKVREAGLLKDISPVYDALYNSGYSTAINRRGCTAETREKVLEDLKGWAGDSKGAKIYWMSGMAGTGKTTISYTFCVWLKGNSQLGGNYFCSRSSVLCRNVNNIIPTLAHQLAKYSRSFRSTLCNVLEEEPEAGKLNVEEQFRKLIQRPLEAVKIAIPDNVVIVIDALDECDDSSPSRLFLDTLLNLTINLPIKFFITSRPEPAIHAKMSAPHHSHSALYLHDIEESIVSADIKKYLTEALSPMSPIPSSEDVEQLVKSAGKLFIYAATAIRYICPGDSDVDCGTRLQTLLGMVSGSTEQYDDLNELYTNILYAALYPPHKCRVQGERENILRLLKTVVCAVKPMSTQTLASFLGLTEKQVHFSLEPLRSVLHIRENVEELIVPFHASFPDFLFDKCRSKGEFHCERRIHDEVLANCCFDLMKKELRFNVCNLESSFVPDKDVPNLPERIKSSISPALSYACWYWGRHFRLGDLTDTCLYGKLVDFLRNRLLFWMEVLNLEQYLEEGQYILGQAREVLDIDLYPDTMKELKDAEEFISYMINPWTQCMPSTSHIYIFGLAFCPRTSSVHKNYWEHTRGLIDINQLDSSLIQRYSDSSVNSVAFSPDSTRIVSGSSDQTIRVWDAQNGNMVAGPFDGHTNSVFLVAFSPDGTRIVSGSRDETIRVWDAQNGNMIAGPFNGHTDVVWSVAFSPDGTRIVSGSSDQTIRVWDAQNGNMVAGPFNGHTDPVLSVAFSPDGTRIVSGSHDETIRVWNAQNGNMVAGPFNGHTDPVLSVAFSPDGTRIVSGSDDQTIRVWDAQNGNMVAGPFNGHTNSVLSVAFSPDGTRIVSGSYDQTIEVWDAQNGDMVAGPFNGHTDPVWSVAFSPDGTQIVSGSHDGTIRVWNAHAEGLMVDRNAMDHIFKSVDSIALSHSLFSPNVFGNLPVKQYKLQTDGWITADKNLLLWVPKTFHKRLLYHGNILAITPGGAVSNIDLSNIFIGETWSQCYH